MVLKIRSSQTFLYMLEHPSVLERITDPRFLLVNTQKVQLATLHFLKLHARVKSPLCSVSAFFSLVATAPYLQLVRNNILAQLLIDAFKLGLILGFAL